MPGYQGSGQAALLRENQQIYLFQRETNVVGHASIAVQLERIRSAAYPWGASFQIYFTDVNGNPANPGAFEIDIQDSDVDADVQYCVLNAYTGPLNASYAGRIEVPNFYAKFVRAFVKSLTNAVYVTVLATR